MNVSEALRTRRTVRAFLPDPIPRVTLEGILSDALRTPSWANTQPWEVYVAAGEVLDHLRAISLRRTRDKVPGEPDLELPGGWPEECRARTKNLTAGRAQAAGTSVDDPAFHRAFVEGNRRFFDAPCVVFLCMDRNLGHWSVYDLGALAQSIMLAARQRDVDSATAINFVWYPEVIRRELEIPDHLAIVIGVALGYADRSAPEDAFRSERRALRDVVRLYGVAPV